MLFKFQLAFEEMKAVQKNKKTLGRGTPKSAKKVIYRMCIY